jgi:hypothetical protein
MVLTLESRADNIKETKPLFTLLFFFGQLVFINSGGVTKLNILIAFTLNFYP